MRKISITVIILLLWGQMAAQVFAGEPVGTEFSAPGEPVGTEFSALGLAAETENSNISGEAKSTVQKTDEKSGSGKLISAETEAVRSKADDRKAYSAAVVSSVSGQGEESLGSEDNESLTSSENKGNSPVSEDKQNSDLSGQSESSASSDKNEDAAFSGNKDSTGISDKTDDQMQTTEALRIDNQNIYEGMNRAYKNGYQPTCEKGKVILVLPLICDEKLKNNTVTASVELGNTDSSPFVFRNYEKDFRCQPEKINGTQETKDVFLVSFSLDLNKSRINGVYPITVNVTGTDENKEPVQNTFTNYVTITDGINPNASADTGQGDGAGGSEEKPTSAPIVLVSKSVISTETVKAGEDFEVVVTCKNTSKTKAVQNMVATINVPSSDFELKNDSNTIFVGKLGAEKTTDLTLRFHVSKSTADGNYPIEIAMSYDDPKANTYTSSGNIVVTVEQPLDVQLTMPRIDKEMTAGDTIPMSFQVMNLGRSSVYNVRCDVICDGLSQTKTAFIGNMESGTAGEGITNIFVTTMEGDEPYGETAGKVTLTYEDSFGNEHSQDFEIKTTIVKMPENTATAQSQEPERASQWWVSIVIVAGIIVVVGCSMAAYFIGRRKR